MMRKALIRNSSLFFVFFSFACSSGQKLPPEIESLSSGTSVETVVIMGTNDLHGGLAAQDLKTREPEGVTPVPYSSGGASYLASYVKLLKARLGQNFIW